MMRVHCEVDAYEVDGKETPTVTNGKKPCIDVDSVPTDRTKVRIRIGDHTATVNAAELANAVSYAGIVP